MKKKHFSKIDDAFIYGMHNIVYNVKSKYIKYFLIS